MAWNLLTQSDFGLASLAVVVATLVIGIGYYKFFTSKMNEKEGSK